jgi:hypothetical protein
MVVVAMPVSNPKKKVPMAANIATPRVYQSTAMMDLYDWLSSKRMTIASARSYNPR